MIKGTARGMVIKTSVIIEGAIGTALAMILDIDLKQSKTMGFTSSAFSFKQKTDLLTDIKALDKSYEKKFQAFTEIRNQFAHNPSANDFTSCFALLGNKEAFFEKTYDASKYSSANREEKLRSLFILLVEDLTKAITELTEMLKQKRLQRNEDEAAKHVLDILLRTIVHKDFEDKKFQEYVKKLIARLLLSYSDESQQKAAP